MITSFLEHESVLVPVTVKEFYHVTFKCFHIQRYAIFTKTEFEHGEQTSANVTSIKFPLSELV